MTDREAMLMALAREAIAALEHQDRLVKLAASKFRKLKFEELAHDYERKIPNIQPLIDNFREAMTMGGKDATQG
jgi:hypothetical protein